MSVEILYSFVSGERSIGLRHTPHVTIKMTAVVIVLSLVRFFFWGGEGSNFLCTVFRSYLNNTSVSFITILSMTSSLLLVLVIKPVVQKYKKNTNVRIL